MDQNFAIRAPFLGVREIGYGLENYHEPTAAELAHPNTADLTAHAFTFARSNLLLSADRPTCAEREAAILYLQEKEAAYRTAGEIDLAHAALRGATLLCGVAATAYFGPQAVARARIRTVHQAFPYISSTLLGAGLGAVTDNSTASNALLVASAGPLLHRPDLNGWIVSDTPLRLSHLLKDELFWVFGFISVVRLVAPNEIPLRYTQRVNGHVFEGLDENAVLMTEAAAIRLLKSAATVSLRFAKTGAREMSIAAAGAALGSETVNLATNTRRHYVSAGKNYRNADEVRAQLLAVRLANRQARARGEKCE